MKKLTFPDEKTMAAYVDYVDHKLGFPEPLDTFQQVGVGIHAPIELGRAMHHADFGEKSLSLMTTTAIFEAFSEIADKELATVTTVEPDITMAAKA